MPRKIPDLDATIVREAASLFQKHGYTRLDMKQLARACGTSVGNLYNYYRSKKDLFLSVSSLWSQYIADLYREVVAQNPEPMAALEELLGRWLTIRKTKSGMWEEIFSLTPEHLPAKELSELQERLREIARQVIGHIDGLLNQASLEHPGLSQLCRVHRQRLATTLVTTTRALSRHYENQDAANRAYLHDLLQTLIR